MLEDKVKNGDDTTGTDPRWAAIAEQLQARRAELDARLHGIDKELDSHQSKDWEELAVEREEDEVLEGLGHQGLTELRGIDAALERIADGSYGTCGRCGADINPDRLALIPTTQVCATCARG